MRVVQVNYAFDPALRSAEALLDRYTTLTGWGQAIARAGVEVLTVQQFHSSANVTRGGIGYVFGDFRTIASAASAFRPDVVQVNGLDFPLRTWRFNRKVRLKPDAAPAIVVQDHASGLPRVRAVRRWLMSVVDAFLFSTVEQSEPWRRAHLIDAHQHVYAVMEASTNLRPIPRGDARSASGVTGAPAVLWVGRLNANKDPLTVLAAFERFAGETPDATLTMIYHTEELIDTVRARVVESPTLRDRVRLVGAVPHDRMAAFFSAAHIFVVGSHHEGSGYALMEALACGAIPVVTNIPTFRALVSDSVRHLWTPGDVESCVRALKSVDADERSRVIEHFERKLTWDAVGKRAVEIYEQVIRDRGLGIRQPTP